MEYSKKSAKITIPCEVTSNNFITEKMNIAIELKFPRLFVYFGVFVYYLVFTFWLRKLFNYRKSCDNIIFKIN